MNDTDTGLKTEDAVDTETTADADSTPDTDDAQVNVTRSTAVQPDSGSDDAEPAKDATPKRQILKDAWQRVWSVVRSRWGARVIAALLVVGFVVATAMAIWARSDLDSVRSDDANRTHAEDVAGKYAVAAATLDYNDLTPWVVNLKRGVSPDLQKQYDVIGQTMEQVLTPLRMQTTADLVVAKTMDVAGDIYRVQAVVNVNTKTIQTPSGAVAPAVYAITLDRSKNWMITSVGDPTTGVGGAAGGLGGTGVAGTPGAGGSGSTAGAPSVAPGTGGTSDGTVDGTIPGLPPVPGADGSGSGSGSDGSGALPNAGG